MGVLLSHGPASKVSSTSPSLRKSYCLKCSKPKPGPPVVSISTTRVTPSAFGLLQTGAGVFTVGGAGAATAAALGMIGRTAAGGGDCPVVVVVAAGVTTDCAVMFALLVLSELLAACL